MNEAHQIPAAPFKAVFQKYIRPYEFLDLTGRSRRGEYWITLLLTSCILAVPVVTFALIAYLIGRDCVPVARGFFAVFMVLAAAVELITFPVMVRRMHDIGLSGWIAALICLLGAIPWVDSLLAAPAVIALGCIPGRKDPNGYGANPLSADGSAPVTAKEPVFAFWGIAIAAVVIMASLEGFDFATGMMFDFEF